MPPTAPAYALVTGDGNALASTDVFARLVGSAALSSADVGSAVAALAGGRDEMHTFSLTAADRTVLSARADAVTDARSRRLTLIEVAVPRPVSQAEAIPAWLGRFADDSAAVIWLKDLEGRYRYVNAQYCEQLQVQAAALLGVTDADLSQVHAIDGPRAKRHDGPEPAHLEYTIPAFELRPAFSALRFPIEDAAGTSLAVCGVAARIDQGELAREECERLLAAVLWFRGDAQALREATMGTWGITAVRPQITNLVRAGAGELGGPAPTSSTAPVSSAEFTRLERQLDDLQRQVSALLGTLPQALAASDAPIPGGTGLAGADDAGIPGGQLHELSPALATANARAAAAESARHALEARVSRLVEQLGASQRQVVELQAALDAAHDQKARLERAIAAAAGPLAPPTAKATVNLPGYAQAADLGDPSIAGGRLGWDEAAQHVLSEGLRGCLNTRSIFSEAVRLIGTGGGWDAVVAWLPSASDGSLGCAATWVAAPTDMARLETSLWQIQQSPTASAVGAAAQRGQPVWHTEPGAEGDAHLATVRDAGMHTVVLLPVSQEGTSIAVIELASTSRAQDSTAADAALHAIERELSSASQRLSDSASATQWGRRRR